MAYLLSFLKFPYTDEFNKESGTLKLHGTLNSYLPMCIASVMPDSAVYEFSISAELFDRECQQTFP